MIRPPSLMDVAAGAVPVALVADREVSRRPAHRAPDHPAGAPAALVVWAVNENGERKDRDPLEVVTLKGRPEARLRELARLTQRWPGAAIEEVAACPGRGRKA